MSMRYCRFCGKDISHLSRRATICGSIECKRAYDNWNRKNKNRDRFCIICHSNINNLHHSRLLCENPDCHKQYQKDKYNKQRLITCTKCGNLFYGTPKRLVCDECKKNVVKKYKTQEQFIYCKYCNKLIKKLVKNITKEIPIERHDGVCDECKKNNNIKSSKRMMEHNPMFNEEVRRKVSNTKSNGTNINYDPYKYKKPKLTKEDISKRMKEYNPMFNEEVRRKVSNTFKRKINNGELIYKKGKDNHNWKGGQNLNKSIRIELRHWVSELFEKYNYTCQRCGKTNTELHVHHIEPLRDIIEKYSKKYNITRENFIDNPNYKDFINDLLQYHYNNDIGIVVCPTCHQILDKYYNKPIK